MKRLNIVTESLLQLIIIRDYTIKIIPPTIEKQNVHSIRFIFAFIILEINVNI